MQTRESTDAVALKRAHVSLMDHLHKLEEVIQSPGEHILAEVRVLLETAQTYLNEHFALEEGNGKIPPIEQQVPRLEPMIEQLRTEHRELARSLSALLTDARAAAELDEALREEVRLWVHRVREHEFRENDLLQEAYLRDIGVKD